MQHNWNLTPEEGSSEGSENPYDNPSFFEKYSRMPRSLQGLAGAGEWETLIPLLPPFSGCSTLYTKVPPGRSHRETRSRKSS